MIFKVKCRRKIILLFYYFLLTKNKVARDRKNVPNKKKNIGQLYTCFCSRPLKRASECTSKRESADCGNFVAL